MSDIGKIMNGYGLTNYDITPKGWDWTDILVRNPSVFPFSFFNKGSSNTN